MSFITQLRDDIAALTTERNTLLDELDTLATDDGVERSADEQTARAAEITALSLIHI